MNADYVSSSGYFPKMPDVLSAHTVPDQFLHIKQTPNWTEDISFRQAYQFTKEQKSRSSENVPQKSGRSLFHEILPEVGDDDRDQVKKSFFEAEDLLGTKTVQYTYKLKYK